MPKNVVDKPKFGGSASCATPLAVVYYKHQEEDRQRELIGIETQFQEE